MNKNHVLFFILILFLDFGLSQNSIKIDAELHPDNKTITIVQDLEFFNPSTEELNEIYLQDWTHSYSAKNTPLANRFAEEFKNTFHFAKDDDRGETSISKLTINNQDLEFERLKNQIDIIKINLEEPLQANSSISIHLEYTLQIQNDKFTRYGVSSNNDYNLRYWLIVPAVYNGNWQYYSNKDLNDQFISPYNIDLIFKYPKSYQLISALDIVNESNNQVKKTTILSGKNVLRDKLSLVQEEKYNTVKTDFYDIISNVDVEKLKPFETAIINDKVAKYITDLFGDYPNKKMLLTYIDYKKEPIYGLNLLPDFIRPFQNTFQYEFKILKLSLRNYLENTLSLNPRTDQWIIDGIQTYVLMKYAETYYPNTKILGDLAKVWGVRSFHAADLKFNDQYNFLYLHMARSAIDQPIGMAKDSLIKFNKNISNKYKAGTGLNYLNDYVGNSVIDSTLFNFVKTEKLKPINSTYFKEALTKVTYKNIDWFFKEYIATNNKIDYKIKRVKTKNDSLIITLKNLRNSKMPYSFYELEKDSIISKKWFKGFIGDTTIVVKNKNQTRFAINHENTFPDFNMRNNFKNVKGIFNKPLQFKLFKDIENPNYNQIFFMPEIEYNFYDGITIGPKLYNKTILSKRFLYRISPLYATKSKQFVGSGSLVYNFLNENEANFKTKLGFSGEYFNYAPNLSYYTYNPYAIFSFRNPKDLRDNYSRRLIFRYVTVSRDVDPTGEFETIGEPKYSVFNASYGESDLNLKNTFSWGTGLQIAKDFGKITASIQYRKLTESNRQFNVRLYSGLFLYNKTTNDSDFFSFALDRPSDYLFDYDYLGRSETEGLLSQQLITSEGGFKSKLSTPFANQWITTANTSTTIWRYVMAYGDIGLINNKGFKPRLVYDSGIRLNLVEDYFELYFPVYSNLGWEIAEKNYDERIRFKVTLSPKTLLGLFTRRWY